MKEWEVLAIHAFYMQPFSYCLMKASITDERDKWMHLSCAKVKEAPEEDWYCKQLRTFCFVFWMVTPVYVFKTMKF